MSFDLVTYCSENYADSLNFCLPWWANHSGCSAIIVYTDGKWSRPWPKLALKVPVMYRPGLYGKDEILKYDLPKCDDWLENVGRLPIVCDDYVQSAKDDTLFAFMATDCLIIRDVSDVFGLLGNDGKWLGALRAGSMTRSAVDCFFAKVNEDARTFTRRWVILSEAFKQAGIGMVEGEVAYDQMSYAVLVRISYKEAVSLNETLLLNEQNDLDTWKLSVERHGKNMRGLHFKGGRWRDKELVAEMLKLAEVNDGQRVS